MKRVKQEPKPRKPRKSRSRVARGEPDRRLAQCADCGQYVGTAKLFTVRHRDRLCAACGQPAIDQWNELVKEPLQ